MEKLKHKLKIYKNGFTLAEVLITLVIIGVVAALTIPTAINSYRKQEYVAGLKKANSVLAQAVYKIGQNKGYPVGDYSFFNNVNFIDEFEKVASIIKKCDSYLDCIGSGVTYKNLDNSVVDMVSGKTVITSDGQLFAFRNVGSSGAISHGLSEEDANNSFGRLFVDINGGKKPNIVGYDVFAFYVVENKGIVPAGSYSTVSCKNTSHGWGCAARVLRENAINY